MALKIPKNINVKLESVTTCKLSYNGVVIENLRETSAWKGFIELQAPDGSELILEEDLTGAEPRYCRVVKGTPDFLEKLLTPPAKD